MKCVIRNRSTQEETVIEAYAFGVSYERHGVDTLPCLLLHSIGEDGSLIVRPVPRFEGTLYEFVIKPS